MKINSGLCLLSDLAKNKKEGDFHLPSFQIYVARTRIELVSRV